ncbi:uncharacterized protein LOC144338178 isoform X2 [Macaca mulatta]
MEAGHQRERGTLSMGETGAAQAPEATACSAAPLWSPGQPLDIWTFDLEDKPPRGHVPVCTHPLEGRTTSQREHHQPAGAPPASGSTTSQREHHQPAGAPPASGSTTSQREHQARKPPAQAQRRSLIPGQPYPAS